MMLEMMAICNVIRVVVLQFAVQFLNNLGGVYKGN
jgi:hypothetical protein